MRKVFSTRTQEAWSKLLMGRETCVTPVLDIDEALDSQWAKTSGVIGSSGGRPVLNQPLRFTPAVEAGGAPSLGQHTERVMRRLGYGPQEIERLRLTGAVA